MNENMQTLLDFLNESEEQQEQTTAAAAAPASNLNPADAGAVGGTAKPQQEKKPIAPKLEKAPGITIPGGITGLLLFILFIIFAVMPTGGGQTRLQLLWSILTKGGGFRTDYDANPNPHKDTGTNDRQEVPHRATINGWELDPATGWRPAMEF